MSHDAASLETFGVKCDNIPAILKTSVILLLSSCFETQAEPFCDRVNEYSTLVITAQPEATGQHLADNYLTIELSLSREESLFVVAKNVKTSSSLQACQLPVNVTSWLSSVVLYQVTHVCVGEEVTGGDAADRLVDVQGCNLSRCPENPNMSILGFKNTAAHQQCVLD